MKQKTKFKQTGIGMIPEDWEIEKIVKMVNVKMGQSPPGFSFNNTGEGIFFMQGVRTFGEKYPSFDTFTKIITRKAREGSVLLSVRAPVGNINITKKELCIGRGLSALNMKNGNNEFLYYLLKNYNKYILNFENGSVFGSINKQEIENLRLPFPPLPEQKAIAKILSDLDSKIKTLQKQNETLEKIGQLLFKRWFVDSEFPDDRGKAYKSNGGEMVESEMGEIPVGWRIGKLGEIVSLSTGKGLKRHEFIKNGKYAVFGANGVIGKTANYLFDEKLILTGRVGTLGTLHLINKRVWISDNVLISKPLSEENYYFAYFILKSFDFKSLNRGSTQPLITQTDLKNQEVIMPDGKVLNQFHNILSSFFDEIDSAKIQIQSLTKLRDTLLPKLMNGKVRVK